MANGGQSALYVKIKNVGFCLLQQKHKDLTFSKNLSFIKRISIDTFIQQGCIKLFINDIYDPKDLYLK